MMIATSYVKICSDHAHRWVCREANSREEGARVQREGCRSRASTKGVRHSCCVMARLHQSLRRPLLYRSVCPLPVFLNESSFVIASFSSPLSRLVRFACPKAGMLSLLELAIGLVFFVLSEPIIVLL